MASLGDRDHRSLVVTQDNITSSPAAEDSIGVWLPDPEGLRDIPVEEDLWKTDLYWPGRIRHST